MSRRRGDDSGDTLFDLPLKGGGEPPAGDGKEERREERRSRDSGADEPRGARRRPPPAGEAEATGAGGRGGGRAETDAEPEAEAGTAATTEEEPVPWPGPARPAPAARRLAAGIIDLGVLAVALSAVLGGLAALGAPWRPAEIWPALLAFLLVLSFAWTFLPLVFWSRTPGMALYGLLARALDGGPPSFRQALLRWVGGVVTTVALGLPALLGLLGISFVDRLSGTRTWWRTAERR